MTGFFLSFRWTKEKVVQMGKVLTRKRRVGVVVPLSFVLGRSKLPGAERFRINGKDVLRFYVRDN